jgi:hypothetical protein
MSESSFQIPKNTLFSVMRRSLHILSLLQHSSGEKWNTKTLADVLSLVPGEEDVNEKNISVCIERLKASGFPIVTEKGARHMYLSRDLHKDEILEILEYYIGASVEELSITDTFGNYIEENNSMSLWMIARVYFAALEKRKILISYRSESKNEFTDYIVHPYRWLYRDNALYLAAYRPDKGVVLFRLTRFGGLSVLDEHFTDEMNSAAELLSKSLGAFIGSNVYRVTLEFDHELKSRIIEEFGRLDLSFDAESDSVSRVSFDACDLLSVCRVVFPFAGRVHILEPTEARDEMTRLLEGNMKAMKS